MKFTSGYNLLPSKKGVMGGKVIYGKDVLDRNISSDTTYHLSQQAVSGLGGEFRT